MGFAGASKPAFQGKQRGLNILSSFAGRDQQLCSKQTNKQAAFLLLLPFFPCGLRCGTLRGDRSCWMQQAGKQVSGFGWMGGKGKWHAVSTSRSAGKALASLLGSH